MLRTAMTALWPPKPNELLSATMLPDGQVTCGLGDDVERDLRILVFQVDGDRSLALVDRQDGQDGLNGAGGAQQVAHLGLGGGDRHVVHMGAQGGPQRRVLGLVADGGGGCVRVDVDHVLGLDAAVEHRCLQRAGGAQALRGPVR